MNRQEAIASGSVRYHGKICKACGATERFLSSGNCCACTKSVTWRNHLKRAYGLSVEEYEELLKRQGGECAICKTAVSVGISTKLHLDHCHATGTVRGFLCNECDTGLGKFKDNPALLLAAVDYLNKGKF